MRTFLASSTVLVTIVGSLAFGIGFGYVAILGILHSFGHRQRREAAAPATAVIATSASTH